MRIANNWNDYELLDATNGFRLERWGSVLLQRPDPQVIWKSRQKTDAWREVDAVYSRSEKGGGNWRYNRKFPEKWDIKYKDLTFVVSPTGFKHTGVFPEQAANWDKYREILKGTNGKKVLNLFGYTGGATLACAAEGAAVTHVDASKGMVAWARENAKKSGLAEKPIRWIVDDCQKFAEREQRRGSKYDGIIMDPPSFGRGPGGEVWKLEDAIYDLLLQTSQILTEKPLFFTVNSYTTGLAPSVMAYMLEDILLPKFGGKVEFGEIGLKITAGGSLPCGATAFWSAE